MVLGESFIVKRLLSTRIFELKILIMSSKLPATTTKISF